MARQFFKLDEPWTFVDWDRIIDGIYGLLKKVDKLEARNKELEDSLDQHILLEDIKSKEIRQLKLELAWKDRE
jgi:hypothetical protein